MIKEEYKKYRKEVETRVDTVKNGIPGHRSAHRDGYSFSVPDFDAQIEIWDYVWKQSDNTRAQLQAYFFVEKYADKKELLNKIWGVTESWQDKVNEWGLCDALAKIYTKALEQNENKVYATLKKWNRDTSLWKRRQSVVSLLYYSRTKKVFLPFEKISALVKTLLIDKEYYVQKGVGWCLRELCTVYPEQGYSFLKKNIKNISAIAFTISIEKMNLEQKSELKRMRK